MNSLVQRPKVIIRHCDSYDVERIRRIIREGLEELDLHPFGKTLVKPNIVAAGSLFPHAYTRPEFVEGVLFALRDRDRGELIELAVGERCGITIPTRTVFRESGYLEMVRRLGVEYYYFEEEQQVEIQLTHPRRLRDYIYTPKPVAEADFFVNCPKFKAHPWTTVTFGAKNYIGIQDDRHRLIDHDHRLNRKILDLQYIVQPQFLAIDGIIAGEGRMLTPKPFPLNLIVMGNNQVAFDSVCSRILGLDPLEIEHIRLIYEDGFGPVELSEIELSGDVSLEEAQERAKGFEVGLIRVEKYFEGTNISAYAGPPPGEEEERGYCWGGCPGALEEAIEILRLFDGEVDRKMPRVHIVFGAYKGEIPAKPGEKVIFIGDCAEWNGKLAGKEVSVPNLYRDPQTKDPHSATAEDIYKKMLRVTLEFLKNRDEPYLRLRGCPVSVAEQVLALVQLSGAKNPYFDPQSVWSFNRGYFESKLSSLWRSLFRPYQSRQCHRRGAAAPHPEPKIEGANKDKRGKQ